MSVWNGKILYLAGPYQSKWGLPGRALNVLRAWRWAWRFWRMGYVVICPVCNSAFMDSALPPDEWITRDLSLILHVSAVVLLPGWERSIGAQREKAYAERMGIAVREATSVVEDAT